MRKLELAFAALFAAAVFALGGCTTEEGTTPECVADVDPDAGNLHLANGCNQFAVCTLGDSKECCKDSKGNFLEGNDLCLCLQGYGEKVTCGGGTGGGGGAGGSGGTATGGSTATGGAFTGGGGSGPDGGKP